MTPARDAARCAPIDRDPVAAHGRATVPGAPPATERPAVVFLMGPTGAGKTALALELASRLPFDLVSVDSAMIYRGLDIGTGKPTPAVLARFPHRLIDICDVDQTYSAAAFRNDALREIEDIQARGRIALLVGGTGLYFRSLEQGISALPGAHREVRARLTEDARIGGWDCLHRRLTALDPESAARIHPHDAQRIQRALEVCLVTGGPLTALIARVARQALPYRVIKLLLVPAERGDLHAALRRRFLAMLEGGLVDEVRRILGGAEGNEPWPALRLVGYRQVLEHLMGTCDREAMLERAVAATRQLAKRQMTWLRAERGAVRFGSDDPRLVQKALRWLVEELARRPPLSPRHWADRRER